MTQHWSFKKAAPRARRPLTDAEWAMLMDHRHDTPRVAYLTTTPGYDIVLPKLLLMTTTAGYTLLPPI